MPAYDKMDDGLSLGVHLEIDEVRVKAPCRGEAARLSLHFSH